MKTKTAITVVALTVIAALMSPSPTIAVVCNKMAAQNVFDLMKSPEMTSSIEQFDDFVHVKFGPDFRSWDGQTQRKLMTTFADADACLAGSARSIRFFSPSNRLVGSATPSSGIRVHSGTINEMDATKICREHVRLKASHPNTVKFDLFFDAVKGTDGRTRVRQNFSAKNALGMKVDFVAVCEFKPDGIFYTNIAQR